MAQPGHPARRSRGGTPLCCHARVFCKYASATAPEAECVKTHLVVLNHPRPNPRAADASPIQITRAHFDFDENSTLRYTDLADEFCASKVYDIHTRRLLAGILAQLIELYILLTDILMLVFPLDDTPGWGREMRLEGDEQVKESRIAKRR